MKRFNSRIVIPLIVLIIASAALSLFTARFEVFKPVIKPLTAIGPIGRQKTIAISFTDNKSGLRHVDIVISQDSRNHTLTSVDFPEKGILERTLSVDVNPATLNLHDGEATVTVTATDHSVFENRVRVVETVVIDMVPPQLSLLSTAHNIQPGGSCLAVYRVSKEVEHSGVQTGNDIFKGYPVALGGKTAFLSYFPVPLSYEKGNFIMAVFVKDRGGNDVVSSLPYHLKPKRFRRDNLDLSDHFLSQKMPEFQQQEPSLQGKTPVEIFTFVNGKMREDNFKTIQAVCLKTSSSPLWKGPFLRMKNAAPMAGFGDMRTYTYQKKTVGQSIHLGVDLASTAHAPIEAANSGTVAFAGYLGIYGQTVIIDHGLGIFSLYAHLSEIKVKTGQAVAKEDVIGLSGSTGLAGGDHLHFSMIVGGQFVNPVEWWDPHWIKDNIELKIASTS
jgi:hypothetical protein